MTVSLKISLLTERLVQEFKDKEMGHCLRVDNLLLKDAEAACQSFQAKPPHGVEGYVLSASVTDNPIYIRTDQAIEKRNRKNASLCLFVPVDLVDAAVSSLGNSFRQFPLSRFLKDTALKLRREVRQRNPELASYLNALIQQFRGPVRPTPEREIDYYTVLLESSDLSTAGENLWLIGLIPDLSDQSEFTRRLRLNRESVIKIVAPPRPHLSIEARVESLKLKPRTIQSDIVEYLRNQQVQGSGNWQKGLLDPPYRGRLTFDKWEFPDKEPSDLENLEIEPFVDANGVVKPRIGLRQTGGPYTEMEAECGQKKKLKVKWTTLPKRPTNVAYWRVEFIPSRDEYGEEVEFDTSGLSTKKVSATSRTVQIPLDIDLDSLEFRKIQARIVPLDEAEVEISMTDTENVWEALSIDFWLVGSEDLGNEEGLVRKGTVRSVPDALIRAAIQSRSSDLSLGFRPWEERDAYYFPFVIGGRYTYRLGISRVLKDLETSSLENPSLGGHFLAESTGVSPLSPEEWEMKEVRIHGVESEVIDRFTRFRASLFNYILKQEPGCLIECIHIDDEFDRRVRSYTQAYHALIENFQNLLKSHPSEEVRTSAWDVLRLDTLALKLYRGSDKTTSVTVLLPTHPLRLMWYLAYAQLLNRWCIELLNTPLRQRKERLNIEVLSLLSPMNLPAFLPSEDNTFNIFLDNIQFLYGIFIPLDTADPSNLYGEVAHVLGLEHEEPVLSDIEPEDLALVLREYLNLHPYLEHLRCNVFNPGYGNFIASVFRNALAQMEKPSEYDEEGRLPIKHFDIITYIKGSLQSPMPGLNRLTRDLYEASGARGGNHLRPLINIARRSMESLQNLQSEDAQMAFCMDQFYPVISTEKPGRKKDSAAIYGLLTRFISTFKADDNGVEWIYRVNFSDPPEVENHPSRPLYTDTLVETQRTLLNICGNLIDSDKENHIPCVRLRLEPEDRALIHRVHQEADWVVTLDRYLGVELFDSPIDPVLGLESEKYVLDYAPQFREGAGRRRLVTTTWQEEILTLLEEHLPGLGLTPDEALCREVLRALKAISGRLAINILATPEDAQRMITMTAAVYYLRQRPDFQKSIVIPIDFQRELIRPLGTIHDPFMSALEISDFVLATPTARRLRLSFVKVDRIENKDSPACLNSMDRIAEQNERTTDFFLRLFFNQAIRLDSSLHQAWLSAIMRFYLDRGLRYRLIDRKEYDNLAHLVDRVDKAMPRPQIERFGILLLTEREKDQTIKVQTYRDTKFHFVPQQIATELFFGDWRRMDTPVLMDEDISLESTIPTTPKDDSLETQIQGIHVPVSPSTAAMVRFELGLSRDRDQPIVWEGSLKGSPHVLITGIPGQGKSWTLLRFMTEVYKQGVPFVAVDFHGQFSRHDENFVHANQPEIWHAHQGLPFSPFEASHDRGAGANYWKINAYEVAEIIAYVCSLGDIQKDVVFQAIKQSYEALGFSDKEGKYVETWPSTEDVFIHLKRLEEQGVSRNVVARCRALFEFGLFNDDPQKEVSLESLLKHPTVLNVSTMSLETVQLAAGALFLRKIYKDMFRWGEANRPRLFLVLDEAHRLAKDPTLPKIMREGRKFGIIVALASQQVGDFHPDIVNNRGSVIAFRTNYPESRRISQFFKGLGTQQEVTKSLEGLGVGRALIQIAGQGNAEIAALHPYDPTF